MTSSAFNNNPAPASVLEHPIYLGKMPDMDPNEWWPGAEKARATLGGTTQGNSGQPLYKNVVDLNVYDANKDGYIFGNDGPGWFGETVKHAATGTPGAYKVDTFFIVKDASVTFQNADGTTTTEQVTVRVMQDTGGNTFLMPPPKIAPQAEIDAMTSRPIVSVEFPKDAHNYDLWHFGFLTDRTEFNQQIPCFAAGTLIATETGDLPVEMLVEGMRIATLDNGAQQLRWIGSRKLDAATLEANPNLRPVRISAGALGNGLPRRDLVVSPQHRILVRSKIASKMFGASEVLVAAKQLLQIEGIDIATDLTEVEYFHFLFDRHEIVLSEGAATESLYTGAEALKSVGDAAREEIFAIFPELRDMSEDTLPQSARILASGRMGRKLAVRHAQHDKALID